MRGNAHKRACVHRNDSFGKSIFVLNMHFIFYVHWSPILAQLCKSKKQKTHTHKHTHTSSASRSHTVGMLPTLGADTLVGGLAHEACVPFASGWSQAVCTELSLSRSGQRRPEWRKPVPAAVEPRPGGVRAHSWPWPSPAGSQEPHHSFCGFGFGLRQQIWDWGGTGEGRQDVGPASQTHYLLKLLEVWALNRVLYFLECLETWWLCWSDL